MRAKEYLEMNKKKIQYCELVKKAVNDLYPIRNSKRETEAYFNRYLFADARFCKQALNDDGSLSSTDFKEREGEIKWPIAYIVRMQILNVIAGDDSFTFAYNIIGSGANSYEDFHRIMACKLKEESLNTVNHIEQVCKEYKEDYPKTNLADYLLDDANREFYNNRKNNLLKDEEWWLLAFNKAYEIFDKVRVKAYNPFKAQYMVKNIFFNDKVLESTIIGIVKNLIDNYTYELTEVQNKKLKMLYDKVDEYGDARFTKIDDTYLENMKELDLQKVNWMKATRLFNYENIYLWATHEAFNLEQRMNIIELIEKRYINEKKTHPDIFIYDLDQFFRSLRKAMSVNNVAESDEANSYIGSLNASINEKTEEIKQLKTQYESVIESLKDTITRLTAEMNTNGLTMPQQVLAFYYLFNELGITFNNSDKTQWARFINTFTGKNYQNIRAELNIDFESKRTRKNLRIVSDLFDELFPKIRQKVINDSQ